MNEPNFSVLDLIVGFFIGIGYWAANLGALNESLATTLVGSLFAIFLYLGGIILLFAVCCIACAIFPLTRFLPCIFGGILTAFLLSLFV